MRYEKKSSITAGEQSVRAFEETFIKEASGQKKEIISHSFLTHTEMFISLFVFLPPTFGWRQCVLLSRRDMMSEKVVMSWDSAAVSKVSLPYPLSLHAVRDNHTTTSGKKTVSVQLPGRECSVESRHELVLDSPVELAFIFLSPGSTRNNNNNHIHHNPQHLGHLSLRDT